MSTELPANHYSTEDEISLIDLIRVMLKRKLLMLGVFVVGTLLTIAAAVLHQQQTLYAVSIEIGTFPDSDGKNVQVEPANTVKAKLDEGIIPAVLSDYIGTNPGKKAPSFTVRSPKNSQLLILEGKGSLSDSSTIIDLENSILSKLKADQAPLYELEKTNVANTLADKDSLLVEQKALQQSLRAAQLRIAKQVELRTGQLKETRQRLERLIANKNKLGQGDSSVLGRLLADAEIEKAQHTVLELEQEVNLDLPAMKDELDRKLAASVRAQASIEADIARTRLQLENIQEMRFITEPGLNPSPTGASKRVIIAVGVLLSALLAIMSVFVAEFIARARVELVGRTSG